jgi:hypothetical protein
MPGPLAKQGEPSSEANPQLETKVTLDGRQREKVARDLLGVEQAAAGTHAT